MPSSIINKVPMETKIIFDVILVTALILIFYNGHLWKVCRIQYINIIDREYRFC